MHTETGLRGAQPESNRILCSCDKLAGFVRRPQFPVNLLLSVFIKEGIYLNATERRPAPRYRLMLFCLVCILVSMLVAWVGITRPRGGNHGFPSSGPRPQAFVQEGKLVHEVTQDVFCSEPVRHFVRLTIRIELNHDRVLSHSVEHCLSDIHHSCYTLDASLRPGGDRELAIYVSRYIDSVNGKSATKSVTIKSVENISRP